METMRAIELQNRPRLLTFSTSDKRRGLKVCFLLLFGTLLMAASSLPAPQTVGDTKHQPVKVLVLRRANIFDAQRGEMLTDQTIIIRGERIEEVSRTSSLSKIPARAQVIDARGKFVIPGLIDAHVHLVHQLNFAHVTGDEVLPAFLAAGVTSVRDTGDEIVAQTLVARFGVAHPERCPRVFTASFLLDADPPIH